MASVSIVQNDGSSVTVVDDMREAEEVREVAVEILGYFQ